MKGSIIARRHHSCVDFSFLTVVPSGNAKKLTLLNAFFERAADRETGSLQEDKLKRLLQKVPSNSISVERYSVLFHSEEEDTEGAGAGADESKMISRGPFLAVFEKENTTFILALMNAEKSEREQRKKGTKKRRKQRKTMIPQVSVSSVSSRDSLPPNWKLEDPNKIPEANDKSSSSSPLTSALASRNRSHSYRSGLNTCTLTANFEFNVPTNTTKVFSSHDDCSSDSDLSQISSPTTTSSSPSPAIAKKAANNAKEDARTPGGKLSRPRSVSPVTHLQGTNTGFHFPVITSSPTTPNLQHDLQLLSRPKEQKHTKKLQQRRTSFPYQANSPNSATPTPPSWQQTPEQTHTHALAGVWNHHSNFPPQSNCIDHDLHQNFIHPYYAQYFTTQQAPQNLVKFRHTPHNYQPYHNYHFHPQQQHHPQQLKDSQESENPQDICNFFNATISFLRQLLSVSPKVVDAFVPYSGEPATCAASTTIAHDNQSFHGHIPEANPNTFIFLNHSHHAGAPSTLTSPASKTHARPVWPNEMYGHAVWFGDIYTHNPTPTSTQPLVPVAF